MTHYGFGIVLFPSSWRLGFTRRKPGKAVFAIGPLRLTWHEV